MLNRFIHEPSHPKRRCPPLSIPPTATLLATGKIDGPSTNPRENQRQIRNSPPAATPRIDQGLLQNIPRILLATRLLPREEQQPGAVPGHPMPPHAGKSLVTHRKIMLSPKATPRRIFISDKKIGPLPRHARHPAHPNAPPLQRNARLADLVRMRTISGPRPAPGFGLL